MFTNIGEYSVGLGYNTSAAGEGSVNINFPDSEYKYPHKQMAITQSSLVQMIVV